MPVTFSNQEVKNILSGLDRESKELNVLDRDQTLYVERDLTNKIIRVYAVEETKTVDPLLQIGPDDEEGFAFFNRYYMIRSPDFDTSTGSDPTDIPGVD